MIKTTTTTIPIRCMTLLCSTLLGLTLLTSCESEDQLPPAIIPNLSPISFQPQLTNTPSQPYNLLINNDGDEPLVISNIILKGDEHCAFKIEISDDPEKLTVEKNETFFVSITYTPTHPREYQTALRITSNAENFPELVIPVCGNAYHPGTEIPERLACQVPEASQPDCLEE